MEKLAYVTNTDANDISVIDLDQRLEIEKIPVGLSPSGFIAIDISEKNGYTSNYSDDTVSVINLKKAKEKFRIPVGLAPLGVVISPKNSLLFVSNSGSNDVSIIDLRIQKELMRIPVGNSPRVLSITPSGEYVCVPCWGDDVLSVIKVDYENPTSSYETMRLSLGEGRRPNHAFADVDNKHVYTANTCGQSVSVVNIIDRTIEAEIAVGYSPKVVLSNSMDSHLYVSSEASTAIYLINNGHLGKEKQCNEIPPRRYPIIDKETDIMLISPHSSKSVEYPNLSTMNSFSVINLKIQKQVFTIKLSLNSGSINMFNPYTLKTEKIKKMKLYK